MPVIMEAQHLNYWIAREIPTLHFRMITLAGTTREERLHKMVRWETEQPKSLRNIAIYLSSFGSSGSLLLHVGFF